MALDFYHGHGSPEWGKRVESMPFFDKTFPPHWR